MNLFGIILLASSIIATFAYFKKEDAGFEPINAYDDYQVIMEAVHAYKDEKGEFSKDINALKPFCPQFNQLPIKRYGLSLDGKFLTITGLPQPEAERLINVIGGDSYINSRITYLTLLRKNEVSKIKPIAHFNVRPDRKITTTTVLQYDTSGCIAEDGEIIEKKWQNKNITFREPGTYEVKLKIKDKNGNWSEEFSRDVRVVEEKGIRDISADGDSIFLIYNNGKVLAKGKNAFGELGLGTLNPVNEIDYNSMHDCIKQVAFGDNFNIYLLNDGTVCAAGTNHNGELGSGDKSPHRTLNVVWGLENIKQVAAGKKFAAALDVAGNVYVWGDNSDNQLMREDLSEATMPVKLEGVDNIKAISLGSNFGMALKYDGTVIGWGDNSHGQLGIGYKGRISEIAVTLYKNVKRISCGEKFSLVVTESGKVFGAGQNAFGQLGMKGKSEVLFPEEIIKLKNIDYLNVNDSLVLALTGTGKAYLWGNFNSPGVRPIYEPFEVVGIQYIQLAANSGKKCYVIDNQYNLYIISDLTGKYELVKVHDNFTDYQEAKNA